MRVQQQMFWLRLFLCMSCFMALTSVHADTLSSEALSYKGSSAIGQFIEDAQKVYKGSTFEIDTLPESSGGEICAYRGKCDLGGVARAVNERYIDKGAVAALIGRDAIGAIIHKNNYVTELTSCQLNGIFTGKITNWSEVGGSNRSIKVYVTKETSGTYKVFKQAMLAHEEYKGVKKVSPDISIVSKVAANEGAIGQISLALIQGNQAVKPVTIDGEVASIDNETYPITRPLYLLTKGVPKGEAKKFIDWTLSPAGQAVVKKRFIANK